MTMTSGTDDKGRDVQRRMNAFLRGNPNSRVLVTIHTHSDANTGELCNSYSPDGNTAYVSPIHDVCNYNLGAAFMSHIRTQEPTKGLLLLACGPAMRDPHYPHVQALVSKCVCNILSLITARRLTASSAIPSTL